MMNCFFSYPQGTKDAKFNMSSALPGHTDSRNRDLDGVRRVYACATMWHESKAEMAAMLNSILKMDMDQRWRRSERDEVGGERRFLNDLYRRTGCG